MNAGLASLSITWQDRQRGGNWNMKCCGNVDDGTERNRRCDDGIESCKMRMK
jgi:hypothetical protein